MVTVWYGQGRGAPQTNLGQSWSGCLHRKIGGAADFTLILFGIIPAGFLFASFVLFSVGIRGGFGVE